MIIIKIAPILVYIYTKNNSNILQFLFILPKKS